MGATKPTKPKPAEVQLGCKPLWKGSSDVYARVWAYCLTEMLSLYYPPFRADDENEMLDLAVTGIRAYVEDLSEFSAADLERGWREVRRNHKVERWPTIGAIREACRGPTANAGPEATASDDVWRRRLRKYAGVGKFWPGFLGPAPGQPGCKVPAHVLAEQSP
jgi:hypothetical protein